MAQITVQASLDGTTTRSILTINETSRNSSETTFSLSFATNFVYSGGYIGIGESLTGIVAISGQQKATTIKASNENWSGTAVHYASNTFEVTIPSNVNNVSVSYTLQHSPSGASTSGSTTITLTKLISKLEDINPFNLTDANDDPTEITIEITKYDTEYTQNLEVYNGNTLLTTRQNIENEYIFNFTTQELNSLYSVLTTEKYFDATFKLITYNNGTPLGYEEKTARATIANANPVYTNFTYQDSNSTTVALTGDNQKIILGYSTLRINTGIATALKSANMQSWVIDQEYAYQNNKIIDISNYNSTAIQVSAVDSRTNTTTVSKNLTTITYNNISKGSQNISRVNNVTDQVNISFTGTFDNKSFGSVNNSLLVNYRFKTTDSPTWITGTGVINPTINNNDFSYTGILKGNNTNNGFEINKSYNIEITVSDKLSSIVFVYTLIAGIPAMKIKGNEVIEINSEPPVEVVGNQTTSDDKVYSCNYINNLSNEVVLYNNTSGTTRNVTLSETSANFEYIEVFYRDEKNRYNNIKVYNPNGKTISMITNDISGGTLQQYSKVMTISGASISNNAGYTIIFSAQSISGYNNSTAYISVVRVVGYR